MHCNLLHPAIPQPDGGLIYRCLTEFPPRVPGCVLPLSTLTFELDGGRGWQQIGDWERVAETLVLLVRAGRHNAMSFGLPPFAALLLSNGPQTVHDLHHPDGSRSTAGPADRQKEIDDLTDRVRAFVARGPFWPGEDLVAPPTRPAVLPYRPYASGDRPSRGGRHRFRRAK